MLIDAEYTWHPFYGSRKIKVYLRGLGYKINRKRVQRLMGILGLSGMAPGPSTSRPHPQHKVYPYLLRGVNVTRPNQVWSTDITYIRRAAWVCVLGGSDRRVLAQSAVVAVVEHAGSWVLCGLFGAGIADPWNA